MAKIIVVGLGAMGSAAAQHLAERGHQLWGERLAGVLHGERDTFPIRVGGDPHGALIRQVVDDRVVHEVGPHLQQERV